MNALAGREAAITSEFAGTTRDVIEVRMDLGGLPVTLLDTAGLRETEDPVESIGIDRAMQRASQADLRIFLSDGGDVPLVAVQEGDLLVRGKADLGGAIPPEQLAVSGRTGAGIDALVARVAQILAGRALSAGILTRERHREAILRAIGAMESAQSEVQNGSGRTEIAAEELRRAIRALDSLVGRVDVEDLLDEIFASFCIGK